jgi:hypothetical protein
MVDYKNGKIYTVNLGDEVLYVGSTTQTLAKRWNGHHMRAPGRVIKLYENFPCSERFQLRSREEEVRLLLRPTHNKNVCCTGHRMPEGLTPHEYWTHPIRRQIKLEYDAAHREQHRARSSKKVVCECGQILATGVLARHKKRAIHRKCMEAKNEADI